MEVYHNKLEEIINDSSTQVNEIKLIDFFANQEKAWEEQRRKKQEALELENKRSKEIECPLCKSKDKEYIIKTTNNGVYGPGYHSSVVEEYIVCKSCGIMYKDLKRPKD